LKGEQLYWEDVEIGQSIPGYSLELTWTQVVKQVQGVQDYQPVHHDPDYARADGREGVFMNTGFTQGACSRVMEDWIGDKGFLTFFRMEMRRMNMKGDTLTFKGKVTNKYVKNGGHYVDAEVWVENTRESSPATVCHASALLPSRGRD
jgi:acyl dehydratase